MESGCHAGDTRPRGLWRGLSRPRTSFEDSRSQGSHPQVARPPAGIYAPTTASQAPRETLQAERAATNELPCTHTTEEEVSGRTTSRQIPCPPVHLWDHVLAMGSVQSALGAELLTHLVPPEGLAWLTWARTESHWRKVLGQVEQGSLVRGPAVSTSLGNVVLAPRQQSLTSKQTGLR